jgi:hypothetical protein
LLNQSQPTTDDVIDGALRDAVAAERVHRGDTVLVMAGVRAGCRGLTNSIKIETFDPLHGEAKPCVTSHSSRITTEHLPHKVR